MEDKAVDVREGEEIDRKRLMDYFQEKLPSIGEIKNIQQYPSGFSNLTYLIKTERQEYVLRRPPFGANIKSAHDMGREYNVLSALQPVYPLVPKPVIYCEDVAVIGAPFYMMERVKGMILRNQMPDDMALTSEVMKNISEAAIKNLSQLHQIDIKTSGLEDLGKPEGYVKRQVIGWIDRYYKAATDEIAGMDFLAKWLPENLPEENKAAFIHNDYKYDNIILNPTKPAEIRAVLDWEMATVGDPLMDLGTTLAYWAEEADSPALKMFNLTWLPGNMTRRQVVSFYETESGLKTDYMYFYYAFASFKIGVIAQQIYARYKKGFTRDPRFGQLIHVVKACGKNGENAIVSESI